MANEPVLSFAPNYSFPPGDTLAEVLEGQGMTQKDLAERTGLTPKTVNEIVKGKAALTSETALQLERVLGVSASFWSNLQRRYDEFRAREAESKRLEAWVEWADGFPLKEMAKWGWLKVSKDPIDRVRMLLNYLGTANPEAWAAQWKACQVVFRAAAKQVNPYALASWLRQGEIEASRIDCEPYDVGRCREALMTARGLSALPNADFQEPLVAECASAGVAVAFVPELRGVRTYGATRWLSPQKALIQLSLRQKSDDQLWFTFFHEAAHIILHGKRTVFLEQDNGADGLREETEADQFACDHLIPRTDYQVFLEGRDFSGQAVEQFARSLGIAAGIVVGRLQHDGYLDFGHLNSLKRRYRFQVPATV